MPKKLDKPKVKFQVMVDADLCKRIRQLADVMGLNLSTAASEMLEIGYADRENYVRGVLVPALIELEKRGIKVQNFDAFRDEPSRPDGVIAKESGEKK